MKLNIGENSEHTSFWSPWGTRGNITPGTREVSRHKQGKYHAKDHAREKRIITPNTRDGSIITPGTRKGKEESITPRKREVSRNQQGSI